MNAIWRGPGVLNSLRRKPYRPGEKIKDTDIRSMPSEMYNGLIDAGKIEGKRRVSGTTQPAKKKVEETTSPEEKKIEETTPLEEKKVEDG